METRVDRAVLPKVRDEELIRRQRSYKLLRALQGLGMLNFTPSVMRMSSLYVVGIYSACASSRLFALSRRS